MVLSDVIDKFTASSTHCLTILSHFGMTVSKGTLQRYEVWAAKLEMEKKAVAISLGFDISSLDNFDKNHKYRNVKSDGDGQNGYHRTTVQTVEPLPKSCSDVFRNSSPENVEPSGTSG